MPDVIGIFGHGPVGGKDSAAGDVVQAHAVPARGIGIGGDHLLFCLAVRLEVRQEQILVSRAAAGAKEQTLIEVVVAHTVPEAVAQSIQTAPQDVVAAVQTLGHIHCVLLIVS